MAEVVMVWLVLLVLLRNAKSLRQTMVFSCCLVVALVATASKAARCVSRHGTA